MSPLFKLKNQLYLTEERKHYCGKLTSNRCKKCPKVDLTGNFLFCTKSNICTICSKLIDYCQEVNVNISAQQIISMDLNCSQDEAYAIGWGLALITNFYLENERQSRVSEETNLRIVLTHHQKLLQLYKEINL